jgi:hypothetical protein
MQDECAYVVPSENVPMIVIFFLFRVSSLVLSGLSRSELSVGSHRIDVLAGTEYQGSSKDETTHFVLQVL